MLHMPVSAIKTTQFRIFRAFAGFQFSTIYIVHTHNLICFSSPAFGSSSALATTCSSLKQKRTNGNKDAMRFAASSIVVLCTMTQFYRLVGTLPFRTVLSSNMLMK